MVLKLSKGGVKTANTLRVSKWHLQEYKKDCCLVRRVQPGSGLEAARKLTPVLGVFDVPADNVPYSLNKKRRWLLPELLRKHILYDDHDEEDYGIQLIEYKNVNKQDRCVGYHATWGPQREVHNKDGNDTTFDPNKSRSKAPFFSSFNVSNTKTKASQEEPGRFPSFEANYGEEEMGFLPTNLQYHVVYPASETNEIIYKHICNNLRNKSNQWFCGSSRPKRHNRWADRPGREDFYWLDEATEAQEVDDDCLTSGLEDRSVTEKSRRDFCLDDFFTNKQPHIQNAHRRRFKRKRTLSTEIPEKKSNIVYLNETSDQNGAAAVDTVQEIAVPSSSGTKPVSVVLSPEQIRPHTLRENYGYKYTECDCYPRKFLLDISDQITGAGNQSAASEHAAFLVFSQDEVRERENVFNVSLNIEVENSLEDLTVETLFSDSEYTVEGLVQNVVFFIDSLPYGRLSFPHKAFRVEKRLIEKKDIILEITGWKSASYNPKEKQMLRILLESNDNQSSGNVTESSNDEQKAKKSNLIISRSDQFCNICYELLEDIVSATALTACGHWFCDRCWRQHLWTLVNSGQSRLDCPEYECEQTVDVGTLVSLIDASLVLKHVRNCHDAAVNKGVETKWCPNPVCGCVLMVTRSGQKNVKCNCGKNICFDCLGDSHWPVTCDVQNKFVKKLKDRGDHDIFSEIMSNDVSIVYGKHCPHCHLFIQKNGGCPYMYCRCGRGFCWGCMMDWNSSVHSAACYKNGTVNDFQAERKELYNTVRMKGPKYQWYRMALQHMTKLNQVDIVKMRKCLVTRYGQLSSQRLKKIIEDTCIDSDGYHGNAKFVSDFQKVKYFLEDVVDLHTSLNALIARAAIVLDCGCMSDTQRTAWAYHIQRMRTFAVLMYTLLSCGHVEGPVLELKKLVDLRQRSRQAIKKMVDCVTY